MHKVNDFALIHFNLDEKRTALISLCEIPNLQSKVTEKLRTINIIFLHFKFNLLIIKIFKRSKASIKKGKRCVKKINKVCTAFAH